MDLLEQENFSESEKLLKEVALLKPNFKDVNDLKNVLLLSLSTEKQMNFWS